MAHARHHARRRGTEKLSPANNRCSATVTRRAEPVADESVRIQTRERDAAHSESGSREASGPEAAKLPGGVPPGGALHTQDT